MWGAHQVDGRISAKNAVKIRAALRQSIDARQVYEMYQATSPAVSDNNAQDRARAYAWAIMNVKFQNEALRTALVRLFAEAFVTGEAAADEAIYEERELKKADDFGMIDWSKWQPGDKATALILKPKTAFKAIVENTGATIAGLDKTGYELVGKALADSIRAGYSPRKAAKLIQEIVGSPARALTIAVTESSRVMNVAATARYREAGIDTVKWMAVKGGGTSVACEKCAQNDGLQRQIGQPFPSGNARPPAHPHCRCNLRPVVPDYNDIIDAQGNVIMPPSNPDVVAPKPKPKLSSKPSKELLERYQIKPKPTPSAPVSKPIDPTQVRPLNPNRTVKDIFDIVPMSEPQGKALQGYTKSGFENINGYLRRGRLARTSTYNPEKLQQAANKVKDEIRLISEIFDSAPPLTDDLLVYRGVDDVAFGDMIEGLKVGQVFGDKGFVSTTLKRDVAFQDFGGDVTLIEIVVPAGNRVVSPLAMMQDRSLVTGTMQVEQEVILNAGSNFRVVSKVGNLVRVVLTNG
jgi:SPP1 gp7 family putative phage head morphogenesis protein